VWWGWVQQELVCHLFVKFFFFGGGEVAREGLCEECVSREMPRD